MDLLQLTKRKTNAIRDNKRDNFFILFFGSKNI